MFPVSQPACEERSVGCLHVHRQAEILETQPPVLLQLFRCPTHRGCREIVVCAFYRGKQIYAVGVGEGQLGQYAPM